ncbi:hypothetical protein G9A89_022700 [Geosiphon pyriformis]|nr:hypothetical protein G9A89_022700 [Geosiphon pyriformis]
MSNTTGGPDFVKKLFKMLEDQSFNDIVSWGISGDSFVVKEIDAFTKTILPRHFKHSNFASFVRQLNKYDFHKIRNSDDANAPYGDQVWEFRHPKFQCDKRDQLDNIKRKTPSGRKTTLPNPIDEIPPNIHLNELQAQVSNLTKLQTNMNNHLHSLSKNYHTVVQDLLNFQKNMVAQDQLMQNLVQYLVTQEADKSANLASINRSYQGLSADGSAPFIPSEQAQKLINSYTEVSRASFDQMNEISRRAQQSFNQLNSENDIDGKPLSTSTGSNSPITPPPEFGSELGPQQRNSDNISGTVELNNFHNMQQNLGNTLSTPHNNSTPPVQRNNHLIQMSENYSQNSSEHAINPTYSDSGLTVVTVGHLTPRQTHAVPNPESVTKSTSSLPTPHVPHIDNTITKRDSNTLRVRRSTFVPVWSVPPKVLLVEDDAIYQNIGSKFLQIFGCTIDIAADGMTAVDKMNLEKYDLVLMDIILPNLDGVEATTQIRRFDSNTPIISMTSNTTAQDCYNYISHGMNDILPKPFSKNNLLTMLERYCVHLKVLPTFQEVHRPLALQNQALVPSNQLITPPVVHTSGELNVGDTWIPSQFPGGVPNDRSFVSATQVNTINGEDYLNMMNNLMGMTTTGQVAGSVRYVDQIYSGYEEGQEDGRQSKRAKFEVLDE